MRTRNSILNAVLGVSSQVIIVILGFFSRKVFVDTLGIEMQGINAALTSVITMLSLTELGIGMAIICNLYKPLEEKDEPKIIALMQFYSKVYRAIAGVVTALGLLVVPFIDKIVLNSVNTITVSKQYLISVFMLFLADVVISYLYAYKRSIIIADQKNYIVTLVHTVALIFTNIFQIAILILTKNFVFFLIFKIIFRFLENFVISLIANKRYPCIKTKKKYKVDKDIKDNIIGNTKALALHYIGNYLISGTDMLIINKMLGAATAGIYSNYLMITTVIRETLAQFSNGITASFGNLIALDEKEKLYESFKQVMFISFVLANFAAIGMFCIFNDFISIWIGPNGTLTMPVVFIIVLNSYIVILSDPIGSLRASAGLFRPDRYLHIFLAFLNLVVSIGLVKVIGIFGVFLGTFLCLCIKEMTFLPMIVYKNLFNKRVWHYQKRLFAYLIFTLITGSLTYFLCSLVAIQNIFGIIIVKVIICTIVPNLLVLLVFNRTPEFKSLYQLAIRLFKEKILKKEN